MIRHKWIVGLRNKLSSLAMECDSCAAIEDSKLTTSEREKIQGDLRNIINYIDNKIKV
jgi:hypothetical protein